MSASMDGSESVDQFLARIASLSRKDDEQEAERNRRMEEEMMQARKERRARREERARSISPVKTGPAAAASVLDRSIDPPVTFTPRSQNQTPTKTRRERSQSPLASESLKASPFEASRPLPPPPMETPNTPSFPPTGASGLSRSGTLSWQQRPTSRDGPSVRSRPLSAVVARPAFREPVEKLAQSTTEEDKPEPEPSRADIAASLGSRDPSWFRQTPDRGLGSAAFRKSNDEEASAVSHSSRGMPLPGMDGAVIKHPIQQSVPVHHPARVSTPPALKLENPPTNVPLSAPKSSAMSAINPLSDALVTSVDAQPLYQDASSLNRTPVISSSARRPPSPTKGLGGFVESAMMRRSDSVSKRWSVQANTGLKRGDSVAGNRPTLSQSPATLSLGQPRTISRHPRPVRDGTSSPLISSRPSSSDGPDRPRSLDQKDSGDFANVPSASKSPDLDHQDRPVTPPSDSLLSRSPSKTLDPRRWSPTKASWLESALSKPDSPRPTAPKPEPPAWKAGLERSRSQRNLDTSPTRPSTFDPVSTGGLLRSPPPGSPTKTHTSLAEPAPTIARTAVQPTTETGKEDLREEGQTTKPLKRSGPTGPTRPTVKDEPVALLPKDISSQTVSVDTHKAEEYTPKPPSSDGHKESRSEAKPEFQASVDKKPPALKPKPQTPPKTDLRSTLRSRQVETGGNGEKEPEFKAVFGKLKRAQTQNYVAPDVLKDNITRGKAGLNVTGGPQKTKRVDEFKESILQRKEDMKAGGGSIHKRSESRDASPEKKDDDIPEALARRKTLHRTKASSDAAAERPVVAPPKPIASKPTTLASVNPVAAALKPAPSKPVAKEVMPVSGDLAKMDDKSFSTSELVQNMPKNSTTLPSVRALAQKPVEIVPVSAHSEPISRVSSASPDKELSKTTSNKLAARLNPALAGLIARGSSPRPANDTAPSAGSIGTRQPATSGRAASDEPASLTHMTKARAKGPKRRAPKAEPAPVENSSPYTAASVSKLQSTAQSVSLEKDKAAPTTSQAPDPEAAPPKAKPVTSPKPSFGHDLALASLNSASRPAANADGPADTPKDKPKVASKSPELRRVSDKQKVAVEPTQTSSPKPVQAKTFNIMADKTSQEQRPLTPRQPASPVRAPARSMPLTPSKTKVNSPKMPNPAVDSPVLKATPQKGLGLNFTPNAKQSVQAPVLTPPPEKDIKTNGDGVDDAETILLDFFGTMPKSADRYDFDSEVFLKAQSDSTERVKFVSSKIVEVTGDGKQSPMSPSQEHILYEDSMYLCVHTFEINSSKATEVYLWAGDAVAEAAIEDAQIFCKKVARENSAKLEVIKQGKESARFFSALGGIIIIRKNKSSALYMLCGRRHCGHVVFDEVDLSPSSLCSGFSFLISAKFGKLYLWIGAGSCADEYGAARLIGTSLGLTGEIEEVSEGKEPASFWESFSTLSAKQEAKSSDVWSMRAGNDHNGFPCKLYRVEQERPKSSGGFWGLRASSPPKSSNKVSLQEITSFSQRDFDDSHVHLLDAYATLYVVPGKPSPSKATDFVSALHIAQELAVLMPSMQDRALLPACQVVFGEPPRDFKAAFRKWTSATKAADQSVCVDVADVIRVLG